jgi:hypothetical protein
MTAAKRAGLWAEGKLGKRGAGAPGPAQPAQHAHVACTWAGARTCVVFVHEHALMHGQQCERHAVDDLGEGCGRMQEPRRGMRGQAAVRPAFNGIPTTPPIFGPYSRGPWAGPPLAASPVAPGRPTFGPSRNTPSQTRAAVSDGSVLANRTRNQSVANMEGSQPMDWGDRGEGAGAGGGRGRGAGGGGQGAGQGLAGRHACGLEAGSWLSNNQAGAPGAVGLRHTGKGAPQKAGATSRRRTCRWRASLGALASSSLPSTRISTWQPSKLGA